MKVLFAEMFNYFDLVDIYRYMQVGNAVSFSVSIPLGYCLAKAMQGSNNATSLSIPFEFPDCLGQLKSIRQESEETIS